MANYYYSDKYRGHHNSYWLMQTYERDNSNSRVSNLLSNNYGGYMDDNLPDNDFYFEKLHMILTGPPFIGVPPEPSPVVENVFVGTIAQSENLDLLKRMRFTHVLNCAGLPVTLKQSRKNRYQGTSIKYEELPIDESERFDILPYFNVAHTFIDTAPFRSRILIADHGVSRSGAIALSYMVRKGHPLLQSADILKKIRRVVLCNEGFMRALVVYARSRSLLDPDPAKIRAPVYGRKIDSYRIRSAHLPTVL